MRKAARPEPRSRPLAFVGSAWIAVFTIIACPSDRLVRLSRPRIAGRLAESGSARAAVHKSHLGISVLLAVPGTYLPLAGKPEYTNGPEGRTRRNRGYVLESRRRLRSIALSETMRRQARARTEKSQVSRLSSAGRAPHS